jgi:hypothetical protein
MSLWQFTAAMDGFAAFYGAKPLASDGMSEQRLRELGIVGFD